MCDFALTLPFVLLSQIYDRDGLTLGEFVKGDMYIRDLKNTKGHISGLTCGEWHPKTKETILTSSEDGSLRIWDVNDFKSQKQVWEFYQSSSIVKVFIGIAPCTVILFVLLISLRDKEPFKHIRGLLRFS